MHTEKAMAPHSSTLAWRIPGTGEPGELPSMGLHRVGHEWSNLTVTVPCSGIKPMPPEVEVQSLNHRTAREAPRPSLAVPSGFSKHNRLCCQSPSSIFSLILPHQQQGWETGSEGCTQKGSGETAALDGSPTVSPLHSDVAPSSRESQRHSPPSLPALVFQQLSSSHAFKRLTFHT